MLLFAAPAAAQAPPTTIPAEPGPGLTTACGGRAIAPDRVIAGEFGTNVNKDYILLPFDVPRGTTAVRVKYCWDRPESGTMRHTLDLGLYGPRQGASKLWGEPRVPRLGRVEPSRRDAVGGGLLHRGPVHRQPARGGARQDHARLHPRAGSSPASGRSSWEWAR